MNIGADNSKLLSQNPEVIRWLNKRLKKGGTNALGNAPVPPIKKEYLQTKNQILRDE